jgi:hypothetical protein
MPKGFGLGARPLYTGLSGFPFAALALEFFCKREEKVHPFRDDLPSLVLPRVGAAVFSIPPHESLSPSATLLSVLTTFSRDRLAAAMISHHPSHFTSWLSSRLVATGIGSSSWFAPLLIRINSSVRLASHTIIIIIIIIIGITPPSPSHAVVIVGIIPPSPLHAVVDAGIILPSWFIACVLII